MAANVPSCPKQSSVYVDGITVGDIDYCRADSDGNVFHGELYFLEPTSCGPEDISHTK